MNAKRWNKVAIAILYVIAGIIIMILATLLVYILVCGLPYVNWHFLTSPSKAFQSGGGINAQLFNSFYLLILSMLISIPLALGAGIWLSEYAANNWLTSIIRTTIEILSSLPSIVVGLFGFLVFVVQCHFGFSILSGALALTIFNLPLLTRNIEDALHSVSTAQREAGLALGLSRWETIIHVIIPAALPGILTGIILCAGRVFGEAAALIFTSGQSAPPLDFTNWNPFRITSPLNPMRPAETLAVHIWKINAEGIMPDADAVSAGSSAVLILAVLIFNLFAHWLGNRIYRKMTAK